MGVCLLLFVGLPACGKTTLAQIVAKLAQDSGVLVDVISIDAVYERIRTQNAQLAAPSTANTACDHGSFDRSVWRQAQEEAFLEAVGWLECFGSAAKCQESDFDGGREGRLLVIDDNHHRKDRRHEWARLCHSREAIYGQIVVTCKWDELLARNERRPLKERIPVSVIVSMRDEFEWPDTANNLWESNTISVDTSESKNINVKDICDSVLNWVQMPLAKDVFYTHMKEVSKQQQLSADANRQSLVHHLDKLLRKWVGHYARLSRSSQTGSTDSMNLNDIRRYVLEQVRKSEHSQLSDTTPHTLSHDMHALLVVLYPNHDHVMSQHLVYWLVTAETLRLGQGRK